MKFLGSLSKGNHISHKGIKIWTSQFDPENWMITKESDYFHCNVYTRYWLDSCSHFLNYACVNRTITHPIQYHLQFREERSVKKKFSLMKQHFTKGHWKNEKSSPPSSWTSQSCRVRWEWPKLQARWYTLSFLLSILSIPPGAGLISFTYAIKKISPGEEYYITLCRFSTRKLNLRTALMRLSSLKKKNPHKVSCRERKRNKADSKLAHISSALFKKHFLFKKTANFCTKKKIKICRSAAVPSFYSGTWMNKLTPAFLTAPASCQTAALPGASTHNAWKAKPDILASSALGPLLEDLVNYAKVC